MAKNITSRFGVTDGLDFSAEQGVTNLPIDRLIPYHNHRFTLYGGERLNDMIRSIAENGVITPIIVRTIPDGKYEILSGHNRVYAAGQAGITQIPAVVKANLSDEEAESIAVITNILQRGFSDLKLSEQAYAVALRYSKLFDERKLKSISDELYRIENGKARPQEENVPLEHQTSRDAAAEEYGISPATVARLLRINTLIEPLKELVDKGNIKIRSAVDLSFLTEDEQRMVYRIMNEQGISVIDMKMAKQLREAASSYAEVSEEVFVSVMCGEYDDTPKDKGEKITLPTATYKRYLSSYPKKQINEIIEKALAFYFERNQE